MTAGWFLVACAAVGFWFMAWRIRDLIAEVETVEAEATYYRKQWVELARLRHAEQEASKPDNSWAAWEREVGGLHD
jgi:hypothetical protein